MPQLIVLYLVVAYFVGFWPFSASDPLTSADSLPLSSYEDVDVNAYFFYPNDDREYYIGKFRGASQCNAAAASYARSENISQGWGYVCCTIRNGSSCYEKIR